MEDRIKELISKGTSAGYNEVQIIDALRSIGANDSQIKEAQDLFKKKSLSDSTESDFQSQEPPSVSESLSSEYIPKGTSPEFYDRQQQEIANSAAADLYTGIASSKLNFREVVQNPKFEENYRVYKSLSNDPIAKLLPSDPLDESGEIKESVMPTLKRGAISFVNDYLDKEQKKQEERGKERYTVPVISELASGAEAVLGGVFKFAESLGAKTGEIGDLLLDDSGKRAEDALIEYGLSDEELSQGFIENFQDGNIKAGFAQLGSTLIQQSPQLVMAAMLGPAGLATLGASAAGSQYSAVQNRDDLTANEKMLYSLGVGGIEYLTEKLFLGDVNLLRKAFKKQGIKDLTSKEIGDLMFGWLPKGARAFTEEGFEEVIANSSQGLLGKFIADDEINPMEIFEGGIIGSLMGGNSYLISRGFSSVKSDDDKKKEKQFDEFNKQVNEDISDPSISEKEKNILLKAKSEVKDAKSQMLKKYDDLAVKMTEEDKEQILYLQNNLRKAKEDYSKMSSDIAKNEQKKVIKTLKEDIEVLQNKYDDSKKEEITTTQKIEKSFREKSIKEKELKELKSQRKNSLIENLGQEGVLDNKEGTIRIDSENENTIVFETEDEIIEIGKVKDEQGNDQIDLLSDIGITLTTPTKTQIEKASKKKEQENLQELKEFGDKKTQERQQQKIDIEEKSEKEIDALIEKADRDVKEYQQLVLDEVVSQEKNQDLVQVKEKVFQVTKKKDGSFAVSQMREDGKLVGIKDLTSREKAIKAFNKEKTNFEKKLLEDAQKSIDNYLAETEETLGESFNEVKEKRDSIIEFLDSAIKATSSQGRAFDATLGIPMFIANNSLKVVRSAYMAGKSLAEAIEAGINYIKKQGATVDKKDYENFVAENINQVKKKKLKKRSIKKKAVKKKASTKKQPDVETKKSFEELDEPISTEQKPLADEAKKQLDVEEKTVAKEEKSIKKKLQEFFFWDKAQLKVIRLKESLSGRSTTESRKIKKMSSTLARLLKKNPNAVPYVDKIFDGSITDQEQNELDALVLGKEISEQASFMRTYVDSLSKSIVNDPAFQSIPESTRSIIENNIGTYMRNSYKFFKDRKFNPSEAVKNDAIQYVYDQFLSQEMTILSLPEKDQSKIRRLFDEIGILKKKARKAKKSTKLNKQIDLKRAAVQDILSSSEKNTSIKISQEDVNNKIDKDKLRKKAEEKIDDYLAEIEEIRSGEGFQLSGLARGSSIKLPNKQLKSKNKDLPETIQALLGIEKDPITRFSDTVTALSNIKYKGMFIYDLMKVADNSMIKDEITAKEKKDNLYRQINDEYSPLNGKFVRSDLFEVISDEALYKSSNIGGQIYFDILKLSRKSKVIWNIPTWRKNLTGGWYTMIANGVINKRTLFDIQERSKALVGTAQGKDLLNKETTEMLELMGEYGLLGSSVDANFAGLMDLTIGSAIEGKESDGKIKTFLDKAGLSFKKFDKWSTENYSFVDDYTKLVIFRQEIPSMARKLYGKEVTDENGNYSKEKFDALTEDQKVEVYRTAAEIVKESTPTFSRLPRFYKKLAKLPFGDFLGFELEAIRSMIGNVKNAASDIKKGTQDKNLDSVQKKAYLQAGLSRTFGVATLFALRVGVATGLASLFLGDDEDLDESAKALRPDWTAGHTLITTNIDKDGTISMYDYSLEDPYGGAFDIITDPFGLPNHAWEMLGPNMAAELIFNITKGKDVYGRDITENTDNIFKRVLKYASYGAKQTIIPPFISSYYRDYIKKGEAENAIDYFSGLVSRTTIRDYRYNANTQFYFNVKELATKKDFKELGFLDKKVRTKQLEEVKKQYEAIVNISLGKKNYKMRSDAIKTIKRNFKGKERLYILYGYEL